MPRGKGQIRKAKSLDEAAGVIVDAVALAMGAPEQTRLRLRQRAKVCVMDEMLSYTEGVLREHGLSGK